MRSANGAIGIGSVVGMVLLYVVGGIGVGLFFMLRGRYVLWRQAAVWGLIVGAMQALATLNEWPLMWMTYDTAVPRTTFVAGQMATLAATRRRFLGVHGAVVHGGRNAWRGGVRPPSAILACLVEGPWQLDRNPGTNSRRLPPRVGILRLRRRTVPRRHAPLRMVDAVRGAPPPRRAGHLCALALGHRQFAPGRVLGRMPVSRGAARRRGAHRRPIWKARAVSRHRIRRPGRIFGAGHAPYPTQPSFARPVELIIPSIGFGLLYVYFGLFPGSCCTSHSMSSGSRCPSSCRRRRASGSRS